jgi:hypothetical protein
MRLLAWPLDDSLLLPWLAPPVQVGAPQTQLRHDMIIRGIRAQSQKAVDYFQRRRPKRSLDRGTRAIHIRDGEQSDY